jgi:DNA invertase Pin-like site-specific DNA recombinase
LSQIIRAGLYERVSTEEQAIHGYSISAQIQSLEDFCQNNNYKIVDHYTDAGVSGGKAAFQRPEMSRLLKDIEAGKIDVVLFTKLDRWFRNIQEYFKVQEVLERHHVEWNAIHEHYDTTSANGRTAINLFLAISQNEREKGSERVSAVLANKRKNKEACIGGPMSTFGYTKVKDKDGIMRWAYDPETEDAVREFWRIVQEGTSIKSAGKIVNERFGLNRAYKDWWRTFNNEMHRGNYKGVVDYCPRYITPENWQRIKDARTTETQPKNNCYLFKGLIPCPECGRLMTITYKRKTCEDGIRKYYSYRCQHSDHGCSNNKYVSEMRIEKWLLANVKDRLEAYIQNVEVEQDAAPKPKIIKHKIKEKIRHLGVVYMNGEKTDDEYLSELADLKAQLTAAEREAQDAKPRDLDPLRAFLADDFEEIYLSLTREEKRQLWTSIIDHLVADGNHIVDVVFKE